MKATSHFAALALALLHTAGAAGEGSSIAPGLRDLMTPEQYNAAGLGKLTEGERRALAAWLRDYTGTTPATVAITPVAGEVSPAAVTATAKPAVAASNSPARASVQTASAAPPAKVLDEDWGFSNPPEKKQEEQQRLYATIKGDFRGWSGKNLFYLDNGQVWRQRSAGRFYYTGDDKRVEIGKNGWGFFEMRLIEADRSIGVSRVK